MSLSLSRKGLVFVIAVLFIAVSIVPVGSLNIKKNVSELVESKVESFVEQSTDDNEEHSCPCPYGDFHNPNLEYEMERDYNDYKKELYEMHQNHYRHYIGDHSDAPYDEPFFDYPDYENIEDYYQYKYGEYVKNHALKNREPTPKPNFADGKTLYVGGSGPGNYSKIQDAIDAASDGDTVYVYSGFYQENIVVNKSIILQGEDKNTTIIDGGGIGDSVVKFYADWININGFTIKNSGKYDNGTGVLIYSDYNTVTGNNISNNNWNGIWLYNSSDSNTITGNNISNNNGYGIALWLSSDNIITGNNINNNEDGINLYYSSDNNISSNIISNNKGYGIALSYSSDNTVTGNNISNNNGYGIALWLSSDNVIAGNNISNNGSGIYLEFSPDNTITGNTISNNNGYGIYICFFSSNNIIAGNNISNNEQGIFLDLSFGNQLIDNLCFSNFRNGIVIWSSFMNIISSCTIQNHIMSGIHLMSSPMNLIKGCCIQQNWRGIQIGSNSTINKIEGCFINDNYWGIKLGNSIFNRIEKCTMSDNYCGIMRGKQNVIRRNNFIDNKVFDAFGEIQHKNFWSRNYWSGHNTPLPCYLYGLNVDWLPKARPYDYPTSYGALKDHNDNISWEGEYYSTLIERDFEELNNRFDLRDSTDILKDDISGLHSSFDEQELSYHLDIKEYLMNLEEDRR